MGVKFTNYGAAASSGFIYQTFYAIIVSLKDDNWDSIKIEPLTSKDKTDVALYEKTDSNATGIALCEEGASIQLLRNKNARCYKKIQVKKRTEVVSENSLRSWCDELLADDDAESYELCLFGTVSSDIPIEHHNNVTILNNDYGEVIKQVQRGIEDYFDKKDAADYSEEDLEEVFNALFTKMHLNSMKTEPVERDEFSSIFKKVISRSPFNIAAKIKLKSRRVFDSNDTYLRDLITPRLDQNGTRIIEKELSHNEFPLLEKESFEKTRHDLFSFVAEHSNDQSIKRHSYIYGTSGSGKTTYLYGVWKEYLEKENYIPIYVPLYNVRNSIKEYVKELYFQTAGIDRFDWIKGDAFKKTPYQIILLLDGFNELSDNSETLSRNLHEEINEFINTDRITFILTSRDPRMSFKGEITTFKILDLNEKQIQDFLGGNVEIREAWYNGLLNNPFMLEICVKTFGDTIEGIKNVEKASMEMVLQEYFDKQTGRKNKDNKHKDIIQISVAHRLYMEIILPLAVMELDKKNENEEISRDPKKYSWEDFDSAVNAAYEQFGLYKKSIHLCIGDARGYKKYINEIQAQKDDENLTAELLNTGIALEVFNPASRRGIDVIWDHEIYRDYFAARGYALYSSTHKNALRTVNNLARQINYRYPEPGTENTRVSAAVRQYHVRKAQMYIDMVDGRLADHREFDTDNLDKLKNTAIYRRLVRDAAMILEDMQDPNLKKASDIGLKYYKEDRSIYDCLPEYDDNYPVLERRYADAAYSISSFAYNYTHEGVSIKGKEEEYRKKNIEYLNKAKKALDTAGSIYDKLSDEIKNNKTVKSDILKYYGNCAAYNIALSKVTDNKDDKERLLKAALGLHEDNLKKRIEMKIVIGKNGENTDEIKNDIASSCNGIATCYYHLGEYKEAVKYQKMVIEERPENNFRGICTGYRNIIGCYAKYTEYSLQEAEDVTWQIKTTLDYIVDNKIFAGFEKLKKDIHTVKIKLTDEQKKAEKDYLAQIDIILESISGKS